MTEIINKKQQKPVGILPYSALCIKTTLNKLVPGNFCVAYMPINNQPQNI